MRSPVLLGVRVKELYVEFFVAWSPFAPHVLYVWIALAYAVASIRSWRSDVESQVRGLLLFPVIFGGLQTMLWSTLRFPFDRDDVSTVAWVSYGLYLIFPLYILRLQQLNQRRLATAPDPRDVLLFHAPRPAAEPTGGRQAQPPRQRFWLSLIALTTLCAALSILGVSLRTCGWLDVRVGRSGCVQTFSYGTSVTSVAFSPDGSRLAVAGAAKSTQLWSLPDHTLIDTLQGHADWVTGVAFSPDGALLATSSWDSTVRLWDAATRTTLRILQVPTVEGNGTIQLMFSPDGALLATAAYKTPARVWRVADGALLQTIPAQGGVVAFSPDGALLVIEGADEMVELRRVDSGALVQALPGPQRGINSAVFSPDGRLLAVGGADGTLIVWSIPDGALRYRRHADAYAVDTLAFSPDGALLASGGRERTVRVWRAIDGAPAETWQGGSSGGISSVAFAPDGKTMAASSSYDAIRIWRVMSRAP
jgi:WD40 repeat protein